MSCVIPVDHHASTSGGGAVLKLSRMSRCCACGSIEEGRVSHCDRETTTATTCDDDVGDDDDDDDDDDDR